ncbi:MAG: nucleotidyltransferase domain-containing protein [Parcubacteria group bacterium]
MEWKKVRLNLNTKMKNKQLQALRWIINILSKDNIQYRISGGFAAHLYGSKREVNDIDIDIPENDFEKIFDKVKDYIILGPENYKDERWNLKLMTLNYLGQEIDIGGAYNQKIFDDLSKRWIHSPANFSKLKKVYFEGIKLTVINPSDLINYKKLLSGDHQRIDIKAVQEYIKNSK